MSIVDISHQVCKEGSAETEQEGKSNSILECISICKSFSGLTAVFNFSATLKKGMLTSLIGPNGAGKTTICNLITGIYPASSGEIMLRGRKINGLPAYRIAALGIGRTFQDLRLFGNMKVWENVMVGRHPRSRAGMFSIALRLPSAKVEEQQIKEEAMKYLSIVGLQDKASSLSLNLPLGQQKLLAVARILASEPDILILDEPTSGLAKHEIDELVSLICRLRDGGLTILLIEHNMQVVRNISDWVIVLAFGEKIAEGPPELVMKSPGVITAYLGEEASA